jgi:hypothetical protein
MNAADLMTGKQGADGAGGAGEAGGGPMGQIKGLIANVQSALDQLSAAIDQEEGQEQPGEQPAEGEAPSPEAGAPGGEPPAEQGGKLPFNKKKSSGGLNKFLGM